MKWSYDLFER